MNSEGHVSWATVLAVVGVGLIGLLLPLPGTSHAVDNGDPGKRLYLRYCSACHGDEGKGDGIVSQLMRPKPTDLTQLAKQARGDFPYAELLQVIDGRQTVRAHGDPDMPVWGELFRSEETQTLHQQAVVRGKVMLITEYLQSLQER